MERQAERITQLELEALVRRARVERDREVARWIGRGVKALARVVATIGTSLSALYEAERDRSGAQAQSVMRRWVARY